MRSWVLPEAVEDILPDEARRIERAAPARARPLRRRGLPAGPAAAGRVPRLPADRHRTRPRAADLQGRRPAFRPHARRARRPDAAGRAHRRAPAERGGHHAPLLRRQRAAHRARRRPATRARWCRSAPSCSASRASPGTARWSACCSRRCARRASATCTSTSATSASTARSRPASGIAGHAEDGDLFAALRSKDVPEVHALTARLPAAWRDALRTLPTLYGPADEVLAEARARLPDTPAIAHALTAIEALAASAAGEVGVAARRPRGPRRLPLPERRDLRRLHRRARTRARQRRPLRRHRQGLRPRAAGDRIHDRPETGSRRSRPPRSGARTARRRPKDRGTIPMGKNVVVIGAQWGDEGKGKIVDWLTEDARRRRPLPGRPQRRAHARGDGRKTVLRLIPSGVLHPTVRVYIGNGVVVSPSALLAEIRELEARRRPLRGRLVISPACPLVLPVHAALDQAREIGGRAKARSARPAAASAPPTRTRSRGARSARRTCASPTASPRSSSALLAYQNFVLTGYPHAPSRSTLERDARRDCSRSGARSRR